MITDLPSTGAQRPIDLKDFTLSTKESKQFIEGHVLGGTGMESGSLAKAVPDFLL
jgi:hypothetical protein